MVFLEEGSIAVVKHLFLSYSHKDKPLDQEVHDQLSLRGLRVWHDVDQFTPGSEITHDAEDAIDTLPGAVFLLTPRAITRPFIRKVELQRAGRRKRANPDFRVVFVLSDVDREAAEDVVLTYAGLHLKAQLYEELPLNELGSPADRLEAIGHVSDRIAAGFIADTLQRIVDEGRSDCLLGLYTYADQQPFEDDDLSLDWRSVFHQAVPDPQVWTEQLQPSLERVVSRLQTQSIRDVVLRGSAHLSAAIAVGYALRPVRGFSVRVEQRGEYWPIDDRAGPDPELLRDRAGGDGPYDSQEWSIEVSISRDVSPAVDELVKRRSLDVRQRHRLQPSSGPSRTAVRDGQHANSIGASVGQAIADIRYQHPSVKTHLFVSAPMGVAVCIGAHLNKCGPIQVYEYVNSLGYYAPACSLGNP